MQLKLLYPRRSRFAPKPNTSEIRNSNSEIIKEGYVKERCYGLKLSDFSYFVKNILKHVVGKPTKFNYRV